MVEENVRVYWTYRLELRILRKIDLYYYNYSKGTCFIVLFM